MSQYDELKRLAEAAKAEELRVIKLAASGLGWEALPAQTSFRCAASPDAVLAMIAENDRLKRSENDSTVAYRAAIDRQEEIRADRDEVRDENKELRKDLESHKRMLLAAVCDLGAIGEALGAEMDDDGSELEGIATELRKDAERLKTATEFVKRLCDSAGTQPSVATGYLQDILSELIGEPSNG